MQCTVINMTIDEIKDVAFGHGFAFGKYTEQIIIDDKLKEVLDTKHDAIKAYLWRHITKGLILALLIRYAMSALMM